jgi:hypothetical protein
MGLEPPGFGDYEYFWKTSHPHDPRNGGDYLHDDENLEEESDDERHDD